MARTSPTVARWELSLRLKERREEMGISVKAITDHLDFSRNYWSAVENNRAVLAEEKLASLFSLLEIADDEANELLNLREAGKKRGWWSEHTKLIDSEVLHLYGLEAGARHIRSFECNLITGLLQTEEYSQRLISADPSISSVEAEQVLSFRKRRQRLLTGTDPVQITALMSQAALEQRPDGEDGKGVLRRQLQHLIDVGEANHETIEIRVVPFDRGLAGLIGASTLYLLDFPSDRLPTAVWQEASRAWGFVEDGEPRRYLTLSYPRALDSSLSKSETALFIRAKVDELT